MADGQLPIPARPAPAAGRIGATSDVGPLARVLVHRPGLELARVPAGDPDAMLFDGAVSVAAARAEHDELVAALRSSGAEVEYLETLLADVLRAEDGDGAPAAERAAQAIAGVAEDEPAAAGRLRRLSGGIWRSPPLPNLMFTRDLMVVIGTGLHVGRMTRTARGPEVTVARRLARHPLLATTHLWSEGELGVEGGDVLLAGDGVVVVGVGQRTTLAAASELAERLLAGGGARAVLAALLPPGGPFHLDLALTMVDRETVVVDREVVDRTRALRLLPGREPVGGAPLMSELAGCLGIPRLREIPAGPESHGRSWDRGANVLAVEEGVVVAYADNAMTNRRLERAGVEVLEVPGGALGKGRGGPRCLTCPLLRGPLEPR